MLLRQLAHGDSNCDAAIIPTTPMIATRMVGSISLQDYISLSGPAPATLPLMENGHRLPDRSHHAERRDAREMPATFENREETGGTSYAVTQADRVVLIDPREGGDTSECGSEESESRRTLYVYMFRKPTEADLGRFFPSRRLKAPTRRGILTGVLRSAPPDTTVDHYPTGSPEPVEYLQTFQQGTA